MIKVFSTIGVGVFCILLGLGLILIYFQSVAGSGSPAFLAIPGGFTAMGGGFIFWGVKQKPTVEPILDEMSALNSLEGGEALQKNNQMAEEWSKTTKTRDQLKMLEISASAAANKPAN